MEYWKISFYKYFEAPSNDFNRPIYTQVFYDMVCISPMILLVMKLDFTDQIYLI